MKKIKKKLSFLILLLPIFTIAQEKSYEISGTVNPQLNGKYIKLFGYSSVIDSAKITNGKYKFSGKIEKPILTTLGFIKQNSFENFDFVLINGNTKITSNTDIYNSIISGPSLVVKYDKYFKDIIRPISLDIENILKEISKLKDQESRGKYFADNFETITEKTKKIRNIDIDYISNNPKDELSLFLVSNMLISSFGSNDGKKIMSYYEKLDNNLKQSILGQQIKDAIHAASGEFVKNQYVDISGTTPEGNTITLKDIVEKNELTLLDFWASWCKPCREENPNVVKAYEANKDNGFTVLSLSIDTRKNDWIKAIADDGMPWHHASNLLGDEDPAGIAYNVKFIPVNYLIDKKGNIIGRNLQGEELIQVVGKYFTAK